MNLSWPNFEQTISDIISGEKNCNKGKKYEVIWPQAALVWKMNVFLFKLQCYHEIHRTIVEIL